MAFTLPLDSPAPDFALPGVDGRTWTLEDFADAKILIVVFSCNHCPYVIGSEDRMIEFSRKYAPHGVAMVAINSNETRDHPEDSMEKMIERSRSKNFPFPYLRDDTQDVALKYGALRTPHYFVFDADRRLRYTGRMDDNPRTPGAQTTHELADAVDDLLARRPVRVPLTNPVGCNVKWWGKPHKWMPPEACDLI